MDGMTEDTVMDFDYEPPVVIELGSVLEVTNGSGAEDTADMKRWYN